LPFSGIDSIVKPPKLILLGVDDVVEDGCIFRFLGTLLLQLGFEVGLLGLPYCNSLVLYLSVDELWALKHKTKGCSTES
jgi:hypothetical protein